MRSVTYDIYTPHSCQSSMQIKDWSSCFYSHEQHIWINNKTACNGKIKHSREQDITDNTTHWWIQVAHNPVDLSNENITIFSIKQTLQIWPFNYISRTYTLSCFVYTPHTGLPRLNPQMALACKLGTKFPSRRKKIKHHMSKLNLGLHL